MVSLALQFGDEMNLKEEEVENTLKERFNNVDVVSDGIFVFGVDVEDTVIDFIEDEKIMNEFSHLLVYDDRMDVMKEYEVSSNALIVGDWIRDVSEENDVDMGHKMDLNRMIEWE